MLFIHSLKPGIAGTLDSCPVGWAFLRVMRAILLVIYA